MAKGDEEARNILIERNLRLVAHVAKKYSSSKVEQDDLISIGTIGLIKGIKSFNVENGTRLSTYVSRCIDNEILMHLRATKKLGAEVYLNEPIGKDKDDNVVTLQEVLENDERNIEDEVDIKLKIKLLYEKMKEVLKDREKTILELRFGLGGKKPKTQHEIAEMMGISRSYVSRIETKEKKKLSKEIQKKKKAVQLVYNVRLISYCLRQQGSLVLGLQSLIAMSSQVLIFFFLLSSLFYILLVILSILFVL